MNLDQLKQSKKFRRTVTLVVMVIVAILIFKAGVFVGYRKATYSHRLGDNYAAIFGGLQGQKGPMNLPGFFRDDFTSGHGAVGEIIKINLPTIVIEDREGIEKDILLTTDTKIRQFRNTLAPEDLKTNDQIIIIGDPGDRGQIEAKLIRRLSNGLSPATASSTKQ